MKVSEGGKDEEERTAANHYDDHLRTHNASVQMPVFKDPETLNEMLIIVFYLPSGIEKATFDLVEDGPGTRTAKTQLQD